MTLRTFHPAHEHTGSRLDQFLVLQLGEVSRSRVQLLIEQGKVAVNGRQQKPSYRIAGDEEITIHGEVQPPPLKAGPEDIALDVVYEDPSFAVVNKPAGMMVHAGSATPAPEEDEEADPRTRGTLVNALLYRFNKLSRVGGELRPGIVHRLDKDTSGLIVVAKSDLAHKKLAEQFSSRQVKKTYIALVQGWPKGPAGTIRQPIGRDPVKRHRMRIGGILPREATSHFKVVRQMRTIYGRFALLEVTIETGRTHQIRVHLSSIGHPVVGDTLYGAPKTVPVLNANLLRAQKTDTKATRDRAQSDLARELTEAAMGAPRAQPAKKRSKKPAAALAAGSSAPATLAKDLALDRNFLHAARLEFTHPRSGKAVHFEAPLPRELTSFLAELERHAL